jgi:hypothetical protein
MNACEHDAKERGVHDECFYDGKILRSGVAPLPPNVTENQLFCTTVTPGHLESKRAKYQ